METAEQRKERIINHHKKWPLYSALIIGIVVGNVTGDFFLGVVTGSALGLVFYAIASAILKVAVK